MPVARLILALFTLVSFTAHAGEFPGTEWGVAPRDAALEAHIATAFAPDAGPVLSGVRAVLLVQDGRIRAERYREGFGPQSRFISWSVGKSMVQALAGVMVRENRITPTSPLPVPEWQQDPSDPRRAITLDDALRMSTGLAFNEDYSDLQNSDAIRMLFGDGARDMGAYAASRPLIHPPGTFWDYSSGTTNIVSRVIRDLSGGTEETYRGFVQRELLAPIGIRNAVLEFDAATEESANWISVIPEGANLTSGLLVRIWWMGDTATSGNVRWAASFERSGTDLDADSFDTATEVTSAASGTSGIETVAEITCTAIDSLAAGERFRLRIARKAADATNDTMTGDAQIVAVEVRGVA